MRRKRVLNNLPLTGYVIPNYYNIALVNQGLGRGKYAEATPNSILK